MDTGTFGRGSGGFRQAMRGLKALIALYLTAFVLSGCGEKDPSEPPKISYGRDTCAECRMIIDDERFASAAVSSERRYLKFDDIGCMAAYEKKRPASLLRAWVRDLEGAGWIARDKAYFVHLRDLVTPMGYGFAAFGAQEGAKEFSAAKGGRGIIWDELKTEEVK